MAKRRKYNVLREAYEVYSPPWRSLVILNPGDAASAILMPFTDLFPKNASVLTVLHLEGESWVGAWEIDLDEAIEWAAEQEWGLSLLDLDEVDDPENYIETAAGLIYTEHLTAYQFKTRSDRTFASDEDLWAVQFALVETWEPVVDALRPYERFEYDLRRANDCLLIAIEAPMQGYPHKVVGVESALVALDWMLEKHPDDTRVAFSDPELMVDELSHPEYTRYVLKVFDPVEVLFGPFDTAADAWEYQRTGGWDRSNVRLLRARDRPVAPTL